MALYDDTTMILWMFAIIIVIVKPDDTLNATVEEVEPCHTCIKVNSTCYNVTYLFDIEAPFRDHIVITKLGILKSTDTLYFSFEPQISDPEYNKVGFVSLSKRQNASVIYSDKQLLNFGTFDIDQDNWMVYLGGSDGIHVLDTKLNTIIPFSSRGDKVLSIVYKGNVYFVRDDEFKIIRKKGDTFDILLEHGHIKNFVINKYNIIVYSCTEGLFAYRSKEKVLLSNNSFFRGITIDLADVIYAWWVDGIYKIDITTNLFDSKIEKIVSIPDIGALTFDINNNILFTSGKSLYTLIETNMTACNVNVTRSQV